jgi:mono/diheme cytochrome c family protein
LKACVLLLLTSALASAMLLWRFGERRVSREAVVEGLKLRVWRARWLVDHMDHGAQFQKPADMMPDLPPEGSERLTVEFVLSNMTAETKTFMRDELWLESENGRVFQPAWSQWPTLELLPGQMIHTVTFFDVPEQDEALLLRWSRQRHEYSLFVTYPPGHHSEVEERREQIPDEWPKTVAWLPAGDAERGKTAYMDRFSCVACHGVPGQPGTASIGPDLRGIGEVARVRAGNGEAAQYLYEALLEPDRALAPVCAQGQPCATPSRMPPFGKLLAVEDMSDLIAYMLTL